MFIDTDTGPFQLNINIPAIIDDYDNDIIKELAGFFNRTFQSLVITQVGSQILASQSFQMIWGAIDSQ